MQNDTTTSDKHFREFSTFKTKILYNPDVSLLIIYPKEMPTYIFTEMYKQIL